jgi:micrococcal nuclease
MLQLLAATLVSCASLTAVDGDTIKCDGVRMRLLGNGEPFQSGIDTPEIGKARCPLEKQLGLAAKKRLAEILRQPGIRVEDSGEKERRYGRPLVRLRLPDGTIAEQALVDEGMAAEWKPKGYVPGWCD